MSTPSSSAKLAALISYAWLFGVVIAYFMNNEKKNPFVSFHIRQSLGLWLSFMACGYIIGYFDSWMLTLPFWIFFGVLFVYGFTTAATGKIYPIPLVGNFFQKAFSNLG